MSENLPILVIFISTAIAIFSVILHSSKINSLIDKWAEENAYKIVSKQTKSLSIGPFSSSPKLGQRVFYVEVVDKAGNKKQAWIRCYSSWTEISPSQIEVKWDS